MTDGSPAQRRLCIIGCGDLGLRVAARVPASWQVTGVRRDAAGLPAGVDGFGADYTCPGSLAAIEDLAPDYVVATLKPSGRGPAGYRSGFTGAVRNLLEGLGSAHLRALLMVSSTRVYREECGAWVDESSPLSLGDPAAQAIVDAESLLLDSTHPAAVLRCGGIYGDPGGRLLSRVASGEICAAEPLRFGNRIHRDDVAGFIWHLLQQAEQGRPLLPVYNVVDDWPAPQHTVERWLADEMGIAVAAEHPPPRTHKRCCNRALTSSGYRLRYPDFRRGYRAVLQARK